jgi:Reverse transcriptase (RNA-dependent DNA polymerase)
LTTFYNPDPALHGDIEANDDANFAMMTSMNEQHYTLASLVSIEYNRLVQAASQWWKRETTFMKKLHFFPSPADPCLFVKNGTSFDPPDFIIIYVDDGLIIGTPNLIKTFFKALAIEFQIKDLGPIKHFVACQILINRKRDTI